MPDFALERRRAAASPGWTRPGAGRWPARCSPPPWSSRAACRAALAGAARRQQAADRRRGGRPAFAALLAAARAGEAECGIAAASAAEIGRLNILRATHLAMAPRRGAAARVPPDLALVDGNQPPPLPCPVRCVVGGDGLSLSIAAASILAKVMRDRAMARLDPRWPAYGFAGHAGYPTAAAPGGAGASMAPARITAAASRRWTRRCAGALLGADHAAARATQFG